MPLSADTVPSSLKRIDLKVEVAGTTFMRSYPPSANAAADFAWDGEDAYGRTVQGAQRVSVQLEYAYDAVYATPAEFERSFGQFGASATAVPARTEVTFGDRWSVPVGSLDGRASGLGGWTLDVHQTYDPVSGILHDGTGARTSTGPVDRVIDTFGLLASSCG